jgi:hypothetical protein
MSGAGWCIAAISIFYWICAGVRAARRPFWYDELVTWHVARLPSVRAIWTALHGGADQNLPLEHLAVRVSQAALGDGGFATRLPALLGFWIMLLCVYVFLRRRLPATYALIGMVLPMLTFAWPYAFEARAYAIVLAGAGIALVAWQAVAEGRHRAIALVGIAAGLAAALGSHYTGVLLAVPFAAGEIVRTIDRRKLDLPVWIVFGCASLVTLMYPGMLAATSNWNTSGMQPHIGSVSGLYATAFKNTVTPLLLAGLAAYLFMRRPDGSMPDAVVLPRHEAASLAGMVVAPMLFIAAGILNKHVVFFERYGIISVIGVAAGLSILMFRASGGSRRAGVAALIVLLAWLGAARTREARAEQSESRVQFEDENPLLVKALSEGLPVVVPDPLVSLAADFYLPAMARDRLHYVIDPENPGMRDVNDQLMLAAKKYYSIGVHVGAWSDFARANPRFLFCTDEIQQQWAYDLLLRRGYRLTLRARQGAESLYEATLQ